MRTGGRSHPRAWPLLPLLPLVALTGLLAWSAWDAHRDHRASAERTVLDYAAFAADLAATAARSELELTLLYAFYAADQAERSGSAAPVPPHELARNPPEADRCAALYPEGRWFARLGVGTAPLEVEGHLTPSERAWLEEALRGRLGAPTPAGSPHGLLFGPTERTRLVAYRLRRASSDGPLVEVHALAHCLETQRAEAFALALEKQPLLPPALVGGRSPGALLALAVKDPAGRAVHRSGSVSPSRFSARRPADPSGPLEGLGVEVTLAPAVADRLVAGGVPPSRLPWMLLLLGLSAAMAAATVVQVRRSWALVRARERFVADVSHELRTPLQQILVFVQLLRMGQLRDDAERAESLGVVERETLRLIRLTERVLAFARPGGIAREPTAAVVLGPLVEETVAGLRALAEGAASRLHCDPGPRGIVVDAPPGALRQVLVNLVDNALKYGPRGQTVHVTVDDGEDRVRLAVEDEGPGVPTSDRERVWEAFQRGGGAHERHVGGSGIGLAVVRDLVAEMGGSACIEDAPGGGARVVVELPCRRVEGGRAAAEPVSSR